MVAQWSTLPNIFLFVLIIISVVAGSNIIKPKSWYVLLLCSVALKNLNLFWIRKVRWSCILSVNFYFCLRRFSGARMAYKWQFTLTDETSVFRISLKRTTAVLSMNTGACTIILVVGEQTTVQPLFPFLCFMLKACAVHLWCVVWFKLIGNL